MAEIAGSQALDPIRLDRPLAVGDLPTPALVVDVDAMERNLERMARHLREHGKGARPHTKTHKCPEIARRQLAHGALGLCCAKASEAEVMAGAGLGPVLITSPVVTADKAERVARLAKEATEAGSIEIVVDSALGAEVLATAAASSGVQLPVLIDLDVGTGRTGIATGEPALHLARRIGELESLRLRGLQAYAGHLMHVGDYAERRRRSHDALRTAIETRSLLAREGFEIEVLTGGGTGTFDIDCDLPEMTDLQVGSYLFMDSQYREIEAARETPDTSLGHFESSLFVLATAISQPRRSLITVDAGSKALVTEKTRPELPDLEGVRFHWAGDEHGILELRDGERLPVLGERIRIVPAHCDPTVNLYDHLCAVEGGFAAGTVRELWPIAARGRSQ